MSLSSTHCVAYALSMGFQSAEDIYISIDIAGYLFSRILVTSHHFSTSFPLSQIIV